MGVPQWWQISKKEIFSCIQYSDNTCSEKICLSLHHLRKEFGASRVKRCPCDPLWVYSIPSCFALPHPRFQLWFIVKTCSCHGVAWEYYLPFWKLLFAAKFCIDVGFAGGEMTCGIRLKILLELIFCRWPGLGMDEQTGMDEMDGSLWIILRAFAKVKKNL